jgi:hypothetical protein
MTPRARRKRMHNIVAAFQQYVADYDKQAAYEDYSDKTFIDDMLYGIGIALDGHSNANALGYENWKRQLLAHLTSNGLSTEKHEPDKQCPSV